MKNFLERLKQARKSEEGSSLIEVVISVPVVALVLGIVLASMGVVFATQTLTSNSNDATSLIAYETDKLTQATNCTQLGKLIVNSGAAQIKTRTTQISCNDTSTFTAVVRIEVVNGKVTPNTVMKTQQITIAMR